MRIPIFDDMPADIRAQMVEMFKRALQRHSNTWAEFDRANIDLHIGRSDAAIELLWKLTESSEREVSGEAYSQLAQLHHFAGDNKTALRLYRRAMERENRAGHAAAFLATVYVEEGNLSEAETLFRAVINGLTDDDDILAFGAGQEFARFLHKNGRTHEAISLLKDLIARYPQRFELNGVLKFYEHGGAA